MGYVLFQTAQRSLYERGIVDGGADPNAGLRGRNRGDAHHLRPIRLHRKFISEVAFVTGVTSLRQPNTDAQSL